MTIARRLATVLVAVAVLAVAAPAPAHAADERVPFEGSSLGRSYAAGTYARRDAFELGVNTLLKYHQTITRCGAGIAMLFAPAGPVGLLIRQGRAIRAAGAGARAAEAANTARVGKLVEIADTVYGALETFGSGTSCSATVGIVRALHNLAAAVGVREVRSSSFYFRDGSSVLVRSWAANECTVRLWTGRTQAAARSFGDTYRWLCDRHG